MVDTSWLGQGSASWTERHEEQNPAVAVLVLCLRSLFRTSPGRGEALLSCRAPGLAPTRGEVPRALNNQVVEF
jgi:hypothetical protein